jgi:hypothetical protein
MTKTTKHAGWGIGAGAIALALVTQTYAVPISGSISFNGNVTPYVSTTGTGATAANYSLAHSLVFGQSFVSAAASGSFAGVPINSAVSLYSPLMVNAPALPSPATTPLWTTSIGGFAFTLTTLTEDTLASPFNTMTLRGTGTMSDGNPLDSNSGTWVATFTLAQSGTGETFSWNSSSDATVNVPEHSASFVLFGVSLLALGAFGYFRKETKVA